MREVQRGGERGLLEAIPFAERQRTSELLHGPAEVAHQQAQFAAEFEPTYEPTGLPRRIKRRLKRIQPQPGLAQIPPFEERADVREVQRGEGPTREVVCAFGPGEREPAIEGAGG